MDFSNLTNHQLYEIIQNSKLDTNLRKSANDEFNSRNLSVEEVKKIVLQHEQLFQPTVDEGLKFRYRILLILFPFIIPIQGLFAAKWLVTPLRKRKWKDYWLYLSLGYLLWTVIVILFARYVLFANHASI